MRGDGERGDFNYPASARFGTTPAPMPLALSQELANTIGIDHQPHQVDLLEHAETAQHWLDTVVPRWCTWFGTDEPHVVVTTADLPRLRAARDTLRSVIGGSASPRRHSTIAGTVSVAVTRERAHLAPVGSGASWLRSAIAIETLSAHAEDSFRRLKLCHEPRCRVAFYDRSKNNSRVWHDTATCGNQANSRAHRARRGQQSTSGPPTPSNHE